MSRTHQPTQSHDSPSVRMKFRSGPLAVRAALAHVLSELKPYAAVEEELGTVEIVLAEALNNIVEHAYPDEGVPGPIAIDCRPLTDVLHVRIVDSGKPMPNEAIPEGTEADIDTDLLDLPEGGFGWFLIHELAKSVDYQRINDENVLDMQLTLHSA